MTPKEAFRIGFVTRCAEMGLDSDGINKLLEKKAFIGPAIDALAGAGKSVAGGAAGLGSAAASAIVPTIALAGGGAALGGMGLGYGYGRLLDIDDDTVKDLQHQELIDELNRQTKARKLQNRLFQLRKPT